MPSPVRRNITQRSEMVYDAHHFGIVLDTREIFLCSPDDPYEESYIDHRTAGNFIRNLHILNNMGHNPILVHMMTVGGIYECGMAIYDAIKNSCDDPKLSNITVLAYSYARSMSSIIPQAATWRVMMPSAYFLIHYGTYSSEEKNWQSVISDIKWSEKETENMIDIYVNRCQNGDFWKREGLLEPKAIKRWIKRNIATRQELYLSAKEAVDKGFMDAVLGDDEFETIDKLRDTL
jgi:ATP-dependent protease ClpP protease subunit